MKELQEQDQRQQSLILRGFQEDKGPVRRKFNEICLFLNKQISLNEIWCLFGRTVNYSLS